MAASDALARVLALHRRRPWSFHKDMLHFGQSEFPDQCDHCRRSWPCQTIKAIQGDE